LTAAEEGTHSGALPQQINPFGSEKSRLSNVLAGHPLCPLPQLGDFKKSARAQADDGPPPLAKPLTLRYKGGGPVTPHPLGFFVVAFHQPGLSSQGGMYFFTGLSAAISTLYVGFKADIRSNIQCLSIR
jgi:hypothetical protein